MERGVGADEPAWYRMALAAGVSLPLLTEAIPAHLAAIAATDALHDRQLAGEHVPMDEIACVLADESMSGRRLGMALARELPGLLGRLAALTLKGRGILP